MINDDERERVISELNSNIDAEIVDEVDRDSLFRSR
jgi:hypothetical protein